ncbi:MAG: arsenic efflux protein [candidate division WS1 bacterium]|jgi:hypothetical protein|nr:arsenic efflux protein [candidate division WS1 bacterium]
METVVKILTMTLKITAIVFVMMVVIEYIQLRFHRQMRRGLTGPIWLQCLVAAGLGAIPGCAGTFLVVSLYMRGLVGFGALTAATIATAGDGAFVLLAEAPQTAPLILGLCGVIGVLAGLAAEAIVRKYNIPLCQECRPEVHDEDLHAPAGSPMHFIREHVYHHIIRGHLPSLFLWLLGALAAVELLQPYLQVEQLPVGPVALVLIAAAIGILPESGAHLAFVLLYAKGQIPLSVLLTISVVQDGHGLIPLLSASLRDSIYVKVVNFVVGLVVGLAALALGY